MGRYAIAALALFCAHLPARAQSPAELVFTGDNIIEVTINGSPVRLEVSAEAFGSPVVNPDVVQRLQLQDRFRSDWLIGPVRVEGVGGPQVIDFGAGPVPINVTWSGSRASRKADGLIGVHHLPYRRVIFSLNPPREGESVERFALVRAGGRATAKIGAEVAVGKRKLMLIFVPERSENLITAPTANFIATHHDGGFLPGTDGIAMMDFGVERPTRMMRIARPIELGSSLMIDTFAVRIEDYGQPKKVGEIGENDPRFQPGQITVSRRKGYGRPDLLTRIGRDQLAHCSTLTYDFDRSEIRLSCAQPPGPIE